MLFGQDQARHSDALKALAGHHTRPLPIVPAAVRTFQRALHPVRELGILSWADAAFMWGFDVPAGCPALPTASAIGAGHYRTSGPRSGE